jgi:hypothetical protein
MKKILFMILAIICFYSCDPIPCTEEVLLNNSNKNLIVNYRSSDTSFNKQISINKNSSSTVGEIACGMGGVVVNYSIYDSVYIVNTENKVIKVYKKNTIGKNIYNVDKYWRRTKPSKNYYVYTFEITNEDIGN